MAPRPPRHAAPAGPGASTTSRPGSPAPSRDATLPARSVRRAVFFSRVLGVGADQPVLGALPADAQTLQSTSQGLAAEPVRGPALLVADGGGQLQRPQAGRLAQRAGRLMQQGAQVLVAVSGPGRVRGVRGRGLLAKAVQALVGEGMQGIADGLGTTAEGGGNPGRTLALFALQQDLATAQGEGIFGAQP